MRRRQMRVEKYVPLRKDELFNEIGSGDDGIGERYTFGEGDGDARVLLPVNRSCKSQELERKKNMCNGQHREEYYK